MKRRLLVMVGLLVAVAAGSFTVAYVLMTDSINRDTYARIQTGMTEAEVIKILRKPCDECYDGIKIWNGSTGRIGLMIGIQGTVGHKEFDDYDNSVRLKMLRWLRIDPPTHRSGVPTSGPVIFPDR